MEKKPRRGRLKAEIMDESALLRSVTRMTHEIIERNKGTENLVLLGIKRRGLPLAEQIQKNILRIEGAEVPLGYLDITFYRDDLEQKAELPTTSDTFIPTSLAGKTVVLVDDVIYTGRTVRAAIDAVFDAGRPEAIQLAVLVDRGHRELPIRADFVGKNIPTAHSELVAVHVKDIDNDNCVKLYQLVD